MDFAILSSPINEPNLMVKTIANEPFVAVMPKDHSLRKKAKISLKDILKEPFLELSNIHCAGKQQTEMCQLSRGGILSSIHSSQIETIKQLVLQGQGLSLLPRMAIHNAMEKDLFHYCELEDEGLSREITLVFHPDRYMSNSTRTWISEIERLTQSMVAF